MGVSSPSWICSRPGARRVRNVLRQQLADSFVAGYADSAPVLVTSKPFLDESLLPVIVTGVHRPVRLPPAQGALWMRLAPSSYLDLVNQYRPLPGPEKAPHDHLV